MPQFAARPFLFEVNRHVVGDMAGMDDFLAKPIRPYLLLEYFWFLCPQENSARRPKAAPCSETEPR